LLTFLKAVSIDTDKKTMIRKCHKKTGPYARFLLGSFKDMKRFGNFFIFILFEHKSFKK